MTEITVIDYSEQLRTLSGLLQSIGDTLKNPPFDHELVFYRQTLVELNNRLLFANDALQLICGMLAFFVVVAVCYFCYKFFRIFF